MLSSILKLIFLSQLIILSLEGVKDFEDCKILVNEVKNKTRTIMRTGGGIYVVGFYADVSSWTDGKELSFYVEMSDEDILDGNTEEEVFSTYAYFTDEPPHSAFFVCSIETASKVQYKYSLSGSQDIYEKFRYKVTKENKKYLLVAVETTNEGGFENNVYFYLGNDGLSKKTLLIIIIVIVAILVIAGIVVLVLFIRKKRKKKTKTQKQQPVYNQQQAYNQQQVYNQQQMYNQNQVYNQQQMYNQNQMYNQKGQTQVLYNEYGQQYVNNVQVNNQGIAPTDNQGNAQYGQYGQTAPYSSQGYVSGQ
jgi:hypothetical protein